MRDANRSRKRLMLTLMSTKTLTVLVVWNVIVATEADLAPNFYPL